ncbi:MAG TPA: hypothetical protein VHW23_19160 [Kofleriaceae bacterium]|nr:hypothetical protein [Kofleriaceae bacterium]
MSDSHNLHEDPAAPRSLTSAIDPDDRASLRFTRVFLVIVLAGLAASAAIALLVDPLRTFGTGRVPSVLTSEHMGKPEALLRLDPPPQAIVLGSSRVMKIRPACLAELTGVPAFNFGLSSSHVEDMVAAYRFARAHSPRPLRELVIGLDVEAFDDHAEPDPRLLSSRYLRDYLDGESHLSWSVASRALFGWQAFRYGLSSLWHHLHPSHALARMHFDDDGFVTYDVWEAAQASGRFDPAPEFARVEAELRGPLSGRDFDALSSRRVALFQDMVRSAHAAGTQVDVYIPPLHPRLADVRTGPIVARTAELEALLGALEREGSLRWFRIHRIEDVHGDPAGYFDGIHMSEANSTRLLLAMFGREHGCGLSP